MKQILLIISFVFLALLFPAISFAADTCRGYYTTNGTKQSQEGICFYHILDSPYFTDNPNLECDDLVACHDTHFPASDTCSTMAQKTGRGSAYHLIGQELQGCGANFGADVYCCAPEDQSKMQSKFPPAPCIMNTAGKCVKVDTSLGILQVDPGTLVSDIFGILLGISGGIAIVIIIIAGYRMMFAQGDPEKLQGARESITSAIIGLLFIIFSVIILRVIGVDIFHLPGLNP